MATTNSHKLVEAKAVLDAYKIPLRQLRVEKVELQASSLDAVAKHALAQLGGYSKSRFVMVEDSGLFINALDGFPGTFSSYIRRSLGLDGVLKLLQNRKDRTGFFKTTIALGGPHIRPKLFTGTIRGRIASSARGTEGFGFDPIFVPQGSTQTFAEQSLTFKNSYSHRARAFRKLATWYGQRFSQD